MKNKGLAALLTLMLVLSLSLGALANTVTVLQQNPAPKESAAPAQNIEPAQSAPAQSAQPAPAESAQAEEPKATQDPAKAAIVAQTVDVVKNYLDSMKYNYEYNDEKKSFDLEFELKGTLQSCKTTIYVYSDMVFVTSYPPISVTAENRDKMAKFIALSNWDNYYSQLQMNYENGFITCCSEQYIGDQIPGIKEVDIILQETLFTLEDYGDAISKVALMGADPQEAYTEASTKLNAQ